MQSTEWPSMPEVVSSTTRQGGGRVVSVEPALPPADLGLVGQAFPPAKSCIVRNLGLVRYTEAFAFQQDLVAQRKRGEIPDQLLFVEHPHVVTMGRNGHDENLLAAPELLARSGIDFVRTDRGGDVTYHGPGQIVGYPIVDLREWKRDVGAYVRAIEQVIMEALGSFRIFAFRDAAGTGVWTGDAQGKQQAKIAAIGVHISRWVTSHGFALNLDTDLNYFRYIVPCGLTKPVTSMRALGSVASREQVIAALEQSFGRVFERNMETL